MRWVPFPVLRARENPSPSFLCVCWMRNEWKGWEEVEEEVKEWFLFLSKRQTSQSCSNSWHVTTRTSQRTHQNIYRGQTNTTYNYQINNSASNTCQTTSLPQIYQKTTTTRKIQESQKKNQNNIKYTQQHLQLQTKLQLDYYNSLKYSSGPKTQNWTFSF